MASSNDDDDKAQSLAQHGTLHPHPERVADELFTDSNPFFDPRDLVQVKYEMLRRVRVDELPVSRAAARFGLSRPTFYEAQAAYLRAGMSGLLPRKKGPRRAHKLSEEVMTFVRAELAHDASLDTKTLAALVYEKFALTVDPRSIERALKRPEKKTL